MTNALSASIPAVFTVVIHPCEDVSGYWAECISLPGCYTDGETIEEIKNNIYEAVNVTLADDNNAINNYSLIFEVSDV